MSSYVRSILLVLLAIFSIQFGSSTAKQLFPLIGSQGTTALRVAFAALFLGLIFKPWTLKVTPKGYFPIIIYGITLGVMNLFFYMALNRIPLGICVALEFIGPLSVAIYMSRKPIDFLWALLAAFGILLILPLSELAAPLDPIGVFYALAAGVCWGVYIIYGGKAGQGQSGGKIVATGMFLSSLVVLPFGVHEAGSELFSMQVIPIALMVALLSSAIPYTAEMYALKNLPPATFGILMSLEPAVAALSGFLVLGEHLTVVQIFAVFLIIAASAGTSLTSRKI